MSEKQFYLLQVMMRCSLSEDIPTPRDLRLIFSVELSTM